MRPKSGFSHPSFDLQNRRTRSLLLNPKRPQEPVSILQGSGLYRSPPSPVPGQAQTPVSARRTRAEPHALGEPRSRRPAPQGSALSGSGANPAATSGNAGLVPVPQHRPRPGPALRSLSARWSLKALWKGPGDRRGRRVPTLRASFPGTRESGSPGGGAPCMDIAPPLANSLYGHGPAL